VSSFKKEGLGGDVMLLRQGVERLCSVPFDHRHCPALGSPLLDYIVGSGGALGPFRVGWLTVRRHRRAPERSELVVLVDVVVEDLYFYGDLHTHTKK